MIQVLPSDNEYLRKMWEVLDSPFAHPLALILGDVQKDGYPDGYSDWKDFVVDLMEAMELMDAGQLDAFMPPEDDE